MTQEREGISMGAMHVNLYDANERGPIRLDALSNVSGPRAIEIAKTILETQTSRVRVPTEFKEDWDELVKRVAKELGILYNLANRMDELVKKEDDIKDRRTKAQQLDGEVKRLEGQIQQNRSSLRAELEEVRKTSC